MENNKNEIKVSKMENILDDLSLGTKIAIGVVTVTTGNSPVRRSTFS